MWCDRIQIVEWLYKSFYECAQCQEYSNCLGLSMIIKKRQRTHSLWNTSCLYSLKGWLNHQYFSLEASGSINWYKTKFILFYCLLVIIKNKVNLVYTDNGRKICISLHSELIDTNFRELHHAAELKHFSSLASWSFWQLCLILSSVESLCPTFPVYSVVL